MQNAGVDLEERENRAASVRLVKDRMDRGGHGGLLQPALQPLRILLGEDALAHGLRHSNPPNPEHGQQILRGLSVRP